jgi:hypothetical protein
MSLTFFLPVNISDLSTNGGIRSGNYFTTAYKNNLLPDINKSEVITGLTRYRKFFVVPEETKMFMRVFFTYPSLALDKVLIHEATASDTQSEVDDYARWKGSGLLKESLTAGSITEVVLTSENEGEGYNIGDLICLIGENGNEYLRCSSVIWDGYEATLSFVSGTSIIQNYDAGTYVSAVVERGSANEYGFWIKETIPMDISSFLNNISRLDFLHRS